MLAAPASTALVCVARQLGCVPGLLASISAASCKSTFTPTARSETASSPSTSGTQPPFLAHTAPLRRLLTCGGSPHAQPSDSVISKLLFRESLRAVHTVPDWFVRLNTLHDNPGASKAPRRVGRGTGGGRGKTCGRGHKGQKARKGNKPHLLFDGGAEMLRKLPKHGGRPSNPVVYDYVNLGKIADWIQQGRLDASQVITMKDLRDSGCASKTILWGIKLLAKGAQHLTTPIHLQVSACSEAARAAVAAAGGSVTTVYYTQLGLRALLKPEAFEAKGRTLPRPVRTWPPRDTGKYDVVGAIPPPRDLSAAAVQAAA